MSENLGFDQLIEKVIDRSICSGCGACVVVCPFKDILEYSDESPVLIGECKDCGICLRVCHRYSFQVDELDTLVFGRLRTTDETFGIYKNIYVCRSRDEDILREGQDGGVATAILTSALKLGVIDGAVVSGVDPSISWFPTPLLARSREEVIHSAGTRYSYSPNLIALKWVIENKLKSIAFVGTPCQILAIRNIQKAKLKKFITPLAFTIGLFCSESFSYRGLMIEKIQKNLGIDLKNIVKINIKGRMLVYLKNSDIVKIPLKEVRKYAQQKCHYCHDFSAELADISLGGVGLDGWTLTIVRTNIGQRVFDQIMREKCIEIKSPEKFDNALNLLKRLSVSKQKDT